MDETPKDYERSLTGEEQLDPVVLNAEELRAKMLLNIFAGQPLYGVDEEYTFFYDETNNIRKFWIREDGLNIKRQLSWPLSDNYLGRLIC